MLNSAKGFAIRKQTIQANWMRFRGSYLEKDRQKSNTFRVSTVSLNSQLMFLKLNPYNLSKCKLLCFGNVELLQNFKFNFHIIKMNYKSKISI